MAVPSSATWSVAALSAAHTGVINTIDGGASAGSVKIRDASDVLLAEIALSDPCGTVSGGTGQLAFSFAGPDTSADATGTAAYAEICDSDGNVHLALPAEAGTVAVSGKIVLNTLSIVAGTNVEIASGTVG